MEEGFHFKAVPICNRDQKHWMSSFATRCVPWRRLSRQHAEKLLHLLLRCSLSLRTCVHGKTVVLVIMTEWLFVGQLQLQSVTTCSLLSESPPSNGSACTASTPSMHGEYTVNATLNGDYTDVYLSTFHENHYETVA